MLFASILPSLLFEVLPFLFSSVVRSNSLRFMVHVARVVLGRTHICHTTLPRFSSSSLFIGHRHQVGGTWIYSSNSWCEFVPQLQIGTPNQSLSMGCSKFANHKPSLLARFITSQLRSSKPRSTYWWCFINQATRKWQVNFMLNFASWQLLEDRLPRGDHESKKNCNPFLWERWHSTIPRKIIKKHILSFFGEMFACHLNSRMIIQYYHTSITRVSRRFCMQKTLSTLQANSVKHPCLLTIHCKTVHGEQAPKQDHGLKWKLLAQYPPWNWQFGTPKIAGWFRWSFPFGKFRPIFRNFCG